MDWNFDVRSHRSHHLVAPINSTKYLCFLWCSRDCFSAKSQRHPVYSLDQHLKPTIILLILLFFGALLGAKFWAGHQALLLPVSVLIIAGTDAWVPEATALMAALALMVALFYGLYRWLAGMRIGVLGDFLILRDWRGRHTVGKGARIGYSDQHLMIGGLILPLALQNQSLFPKEELVQRVYPIMRQGNFIPRGRAQLLLMKNSAWMTVPLVLFILVVVGAAMLFPEMF
jgi:hypothetical protein